MEEENIYFYKELQREIGDIVVSGYPFFDDVQWMMDSLPIKVGGLSLN